MNPHHGNILAQNGRIVGFIDLDWCRVSSYYEDLAPIAAYALRQNLNAAHTLHMHNY
jgi:aminoglycoside phosphotransferase